MENVDYGKKLKMARVEMNMSQADVAEKLSITQGYYSQIELGNKTIDDKEFERMIAKIMGVENQTEPIVVLENYKQASKKDDKLMQSMFEMLAKKDQQLDRILSSLDKKDEMITKFMSILEKNNDTMEGFLEILRQKFPTDK